MTPPEEAARVLVVDDQRVVREGLEMLLGLLDGVSVVGSAADGAEALALVEAEAPDVVLMDLNMPRMDGIEATRRLSADHPHVPVVVLTTYTDDERVFAALQAGARGFLTKDAGAAEIEAAIRSATRGQAHLDPDVQRRLLDALRSGSSFGVPVAPGRLPSTPPDQLTAREAEVVQLIALGRSNAEIADALFVSQATVKTHINHIFAKTSLRDRAQLVAYAFRTGLADIPPGGLTRVDAVQAAFDAVPRARFLPRRSRLRASYDGPILIGCGQTNSQPSTVRSMLVLLAVEPGQRVLDVGAGSGWTTALLAHLTGPDGLVVGVELEPPLVRFGSDNLARTGMGWASIRQAEPGVLGVPAQAPYDRILVSADAASLPGQLVDQLADGGRMVIPVTGTMLLVERRGEEVRTSEHGGYRFVPLR